MRREQKLEYEGQYRQVMGLPLDDLISIWAVIGRADSDVFLQILGVHTGGVEGEEFDMANMEMGAARKVFTGGLLSAARSNWAHPCLGSLASAETLRFVFAWGKLKWRH